MKKGWRYRCGARTKKKVLDRNTGEIVERFRTCKRTYKCRTGTDGVLLSMLHELTCVGCHQTGKIRAIGSKRPIGVTQ